MGSYTAENSPPLSCYPIPPLDADGQLITFIGHGGGGGGICVFGCVRVCVCGQRCSLNNFEEDSGGLEGGEVRIFGGSSFSKNRPKRRPLFVREGENYWRQWDLISVAEIGLAAIKGLLTHTFIMYAFRGEKICSQPVLSLLAHQITQLLCLGKGYGCWCWPTLLVNLVFTWFIGETQWDGLTWPIVHQGVEQKNGKTSDHTVCCQHGGKYYRGRDKHDAYKNNA